MPWIHIKDLCNIYVKAIEDTQMNGSYNAVAPQHVSHREFMKTLGEVMRRPVLPFPVPEFVLKTILGEMSVVVLKGSRISDEKILSTGYNFDFRSLRDALEQILNHASK
jgi:NAD dependent epimerase/dehydratase family enzyme